MSWEGRVGVLKIRTRMLLLLVVVEGEDPLVRSPKWMVLFVLGMGSVETARVASGVNEETGM